MKKAKGNGEAERLVIMISRSECSVDPHKCTSECGRTSSRRLAFPRLNINVVLCTHSKLWHPVRDRVGKTTRHSTMDVRLSHTWSCPHFMIYATISQLAAAVQGHSWLMWSSLDYNNVSVVFVQIKKLNTSILRLLKLVCSRGFINKRVI